MLGPKQAQLNRRLQLPGISVTRGFLSLVLEEGIYVMYRHNTEESAHELAPLQAIHYHTGTLKMINVRRRDNRMAGMQAEILFLGEVTEFFVHL